MLANTPPPPYYAVIFASTRTDVDDGYAQTAARMIELAQQQPGFLGVETARDSIGITVSYWESEEAIRTWHANAEHQLAQRGGYRKWYSAFRLRVAKVERDHAFTKP
jgi:heme-degrading monooxygenase HmoA